MAEEIERLNYYQLQFLGADDFKAEQLYHRDMRRRHNLGPHTWGIVSGLELTEVQRDGLEVFVAPGYAVDGFGREIVVGAPYKLTAGDFQFARAKTATSYTIHLAFAEERAAAPAFGYGACEGGEQNDRVRELFRIVVNAEGALHAPVVVNGEVAALPPDGSVPHQELPDEASTRWLIPLGRVTWNGTVFLNDPNLAAGRVYASIVTAEVLGSAGRLLFRPRVVADPPPPVEPEFADVQGQLQVSGTLIAKKDVHLHGTRAHFDNSGGTDDGAPLWLSRIRRTTGEHDLHVEIGSAAGNAQRRLTVGPAQTVRFAVSADDKVHIPTGTLEFAPGSGSAPRKMIAVTGDKYGIGLEGSTFYSRTDADFVWYQGSTTLMHLDANELRVEGALRTQSLRVSGDAQVTGSVNIDGRLRLQHQGGDENDELAITRHRKALNANDLRVIIGDDTANDDAFTIGPVTWQDNLYKENFRVSNRGDVKAEGELLVQKAATLNDTLTVAGATQLQALAAGGPATFGGDVTIAPAGALKYGNGVFPIDIKTGVVSNALISTGPITAAGQAQVKVITDLPHVSKAFMQVALTGIQQAAPSNQLRWNLDVLPPTQDDPNNLSEFTFRVDMTITSGSILGFSWIAFFVP